MLQKKFPHRTIVVTNCSTQVPALRIVNINNIDGLGNKLSIPSLACLKESFLQRRGYVARFASLRGRYAGVVDSLHGHCGGMIAGIHGVYIIDNNILYGSPVEVVEVIIDSFGRVHTTGAESFLVD
jgi:hypothetical protein